MKEEIKTIPARNMNEEDIARLPHWVQKNLDSAVLIGNSYKTIQLGDGRKYSLDNEINTAFAKLKDGYDDFFESELTKFAEERNKNKT